MLQIAAANEVQWKKVASLLDIDPHIAKYATNRERFAHRDELIADMEKALAAHDRAHWLARLGEAGVPAGAIRSLDEVYAWEQTRSQGLLVEVDHPVLGTIELPGPPLRFDGLTGMTHTAPPALGQHDGDVLRWLEERER
jgi:crotonobetainyl-CoA:carnitine CoA-transferase CaiB-like acyl-CoA transferase